MESYLVLTENAAQQRALEAFLKALDIRYLPPSVLTEDEAVRQTLVEKYVSTGKWANMNDDDREDATMAETIIYAQKQPDYKAYTAANTKNYLDTLRKKLKI